MTISSFPKHHHSWLRWCPALFFASLIFSFSSMPGDEVEKTYNTLDTLAQSATSLSNAFTPTAQTTPRATVTKPAAAGSNLAPKPTPTPPRISSLVSQIPIFSTLDFLKTGHAIGYFWLGWAVLYALGRQARRPTPTAAILCWLYAVSDEFHQSFIPGRSAAARDVLIDTLAALTGAIALFALIKTWAFFKQRQAPID